MSGRRKMISLFKKIVLLAKKNFSFFYDFVKRSILKSFSITKKIFLNEYFSERTICANVFAADECLLNEHVCHKEIKFVGGCIRWVVNFFEPGSFFSLFFSFCLFCCPKMEVKFHDVPFFVSLFRRFVSFSSKVTNLVLKTVSFHNTINYLTTQINNETSFENTTKGLLF